MLIKNFSSIDSGKHSKLFLLKAQVRQHTFIPSKRHKTEQVSLSMKKCCLAFRERFSSEDRRTNKKTLDAGVQTKAPKRYNVSAALDPLFER